MGTGSADMEMPDFKPNGQKTRSFWRRMEYGCNIQTIKNNFFPTTTDLALTMGYKLNDKSTVGIGASYKIGWGKDIQHIRISHQGASLRSFLDIKLKGSFYGSGGFEYNYQPMAIDTVLHFTSVSNWHPSGLVGVSKIVSLKSKFFKKTRLQLLFDFLSFHNTPRSQPVKFRVGYSL